MYGIVMKNKMRGATWQMATSQLFKQKAKAQSRIAYLTIHQPGYNYKLVWLGDL